MGVLGIPQAQGGAEAAAPKAGCKPTQSDVGKRVLVTGFDCEGTLRFFGPHAEGGKKRAGVELDQAVGKNSGTVKGHQYFVCAKKHGVLVAPSKVQVIGGGGNAAYLNIAAQPHEFVDFEADEDGEDV